MGVAKRVDTCALCGEAIRPGTVFVVKHVTYKDGHAAWYAAHLHCNAMLRGATKEKLRSLPSLVPPGNPVGSGVALPIKGGGQRGL